MQTKFRSVGGNIFGGLFFSVVSILMLWIPFQYVQDFEKASASSQWPFSIGIITFSQAVRGCGKGGSYLPTLKYKYFVEGIEYIGSKIAFGDRGCGSESSAKQLVAPYPEGKQVDVYFNPKYPKEAVLINGRVTNDTWYGMVVMLLMFVCSAFIAWIHFSQAITLRSKQIGV